MHFDPNTGEKIMDPGDEIQGAVDQAQAQAQQTVDQAAAAQAAAQAQAAQAAAQAQAAQAAAQAQAQQTADQAAQAAAQAQAAQAANQAAAAQAAAQAQAAQAAAQAQAAQAAAQAQAAQAAAQAQFQAQPQFQQNAYSAVPTDEKVKKGLPIGAVIGIVVAALAVIGGIVFLATRSLGAKVSLINTFTNAYDGEFLTEAAKDAQIKPFEDFTVTVNGEVEDVEFSVALANAASSHTRSAYASITYSGFTADFTGYIDEKKIVATAPVIGDYLFTYDYSNDKNSGYLTEFLDEVDMEVKDFNALIALANDNNDIVKKFYEKTAAYAVDCVNSLDFKKTGEKETFTVNGEKVECKEYQAVITEETLTGWIEGYKKIFDDFYKDNSKDFEFIEELTGEEIDVEDIFDELIDELDGMDDLVVSIYTKGKIAAAIRVMSDDNGVEILFKGGDYLAQNVEVNAIQDDDSETVLSIKGKTKGDVQTTTIEMESADTTYEYSYNRKTGEFTMVYEMWGREVYNMECTLEFSKNEIKYVFESFDVYGTEMPFDSLEVIVSTKADIKEPKKGETFDLGNADEDDFEDLAEEIYDNVMDNDDLMDILDELEDTLYYMF